MKTIKNYLFLLMAGTVLIFSACDESEEPFEIVEPEILTQGYNIHTYNPDIGADRVTFNGSLNTNDSNVTYGFMWYIKPQNNEEVEVVTVPVGTGALAGDFSISVDDLPKNVALVVCAFVEYQMGTETAQEIGEEVDFDWDL